MRVRFRYGVGARLFLIRFIAGLAGSFVEQKAARSMPSGLPGSKSIRDEMPFKPRCCDPKQGRSRIVLTFKRSLRNLCRCALAVTNRESGKQRCTAAQMAA